MTPWQGRFIAAAETLDSAAQFRKDFALETAHGTVTRATLRWSALGVCEAWINGFAVSDAVLTPGWTSYEWRVHYTETDVTHLLETESTIAMTVGRGWYAGRLGWVPTARYGTETAAFAELRITYEDGHTQVIATDSTWSAGPGPVLDNDLYDGQTIDARRGATSWRRPESDVAWGSVRIVDQDPAVLAPDPAPPVRRIDTLRPVAKWHSREGGLILDFGANIVGWLRVQVQGPAGAEIVARHAEVIQDWELDVRPLRTAVATDRFILSGELDTFEPTMTFHGFRYAELTGLPDSLDGANFAVEAVVISSDVRRIGTFECSVPDLNTFHDNVVRGMRGNFVDVPTDCPQRDERMGWTGDISVFAPVAAYLFDVQEMLLDWLRDLELEQRHHGGVVPFVVPDILKYVEDPATVPPSGAPAAIWSDASVWVPWALWQAYGEMRVLEQSYWSMATHARCVTAALSPAGTWSNGFQFGDWLDPDAPAEHPEQAKADPYVVATACAYRTLDLVGQTARLLGHQDDADEFEAAAVRIRQGFRRSYLHGERITSDCVTVYTLAVVFGLLEHEELVWAGDRLAELVAERGHHIATGFSGTPFVTDALTVTGHIRTAYELLLQRECPSWLYPVTMDATTIWERWDSMLPDGRVNPGDMTSFNHYALGAVADWLHRSIGGLAPHTPGYGTVLIAPIVSEGIDWARASVDTPHGTAKVAWERRESEVHVEVELPASAGGIFRWPGQPDVDLAAGHHTLVVPCGSTLERTPS